MCELNVFFLVLSCKALEGLEVKVGYIYEKIEMKVFELLRHEEDRALTQILLKLLTRYAATL